LTREAIEEIQYNFVVIISDEAITLSWT